MALTCCTRMNALRVHSSCQILLLQADIYFSASPPKSSNVSAQAAGNQGTASSDASQEPTSLYKISTISLMGQFLDPPLALKRQLDVSVASNGKNASDEELSVTSRLSESSLESENTIDRDFLTKASTSTSCPQTRKVSEPVDRRGAVKYSGNLSWTTV